MYEGAMCCSSGVCGPEPDRRLIDFSEALKRLQSEYKDELNVERASLSSDVPMFIANKEIAKTLREKGLNVLPIVTINGDIVSKERYPTYAELRREIEERLQIPQ